jgi:hypothetical protein
VHVFHDVGSDYCVEVGLHEVKYQIDVLVILRFEDVYQRYDVRMPIQLLQEDNLLRSRITSR